MNLKSYFWTQVVAKENSKYNGVVCVEVSFGKYYLSAGGLMQSGPFLERVWKNGLKKLGLFKLVPRNILILGLGGGSFARVASGLYKDALITGIDIDPVMVKLAKEYLSLGDIKNLKIIIADAQDFIRAQLKKGIHYDLIFVDLFNGYEVPAFASDAAFVKKIYELRSKSAIVVINRLYFGKFKEQTQVFIKLMQDNFPNVEVAYSYSNALIGIK